MHLFIITSLVNTDEIMISKCEIGLWNTCCGVIDEYGGKISETLLINEQTFIYYAGAFVYVMLVSFLGVFM